jgi:hypothetical protein
MGRVKLLSRGLSALVATLAAAAFTAPPAQGAQFEATVTFTTVSVDSTGVRLAGRAFNTGTDALFDVQVAFTVDPAPLADPAALDEALGQDPAVELDQRLDSPATGQTIVTGTAGWAAGASTDFTVAASWAELGVPNDGVYLMGVAVRAGDSPAATPATRGANRTLVSHRTSTVPTASVVLLTSPPSLLHDDVLVDDHLAQELSGRLTALVELAHAATVSWAIDPALLQEAIIMAQGYQVLTTSGTRPGSAQAQAAAWLEAVATLDTARGYRLPWGNPDLGLGAATADADLLATAVAMEQAQADPAAEPGPLDLASLPLLVRPANGLADQAFVDYLAPLRPAVVLAQAASSATLATGVLLNTLPTAFPTGIRDTAVQSQQRALADDALSGTGAQAGTIRVIATEDEARLAARALPDWVRPTRLADWRVSTPFRAELASGPAAGTLTPAATQAMPGLRSAWATYASLIEDPTAAWRRAGPAVAGALSASWPDDQAALTHIGRAERWLTDQLGLVSLSATPEVALTARSNDFPVTVTNNLAVAVQVRVSARTVRVANSPAFVSIPTTAVETVQPGDRLALTLSPTVSREGQVQAFLQLATRDGLPLGDPVTVAVNAAYSAWMGWVVVGSAGVAFAVGTVLRVKRKSGSRPAGQPDHPPTSQPGDQPEEPT